MKYQSIEATFTRIVVCFLQLSRLWPFVPGILPLFFFSHPTQAKEFSKVFKPHFNYTVTADDNILRIRDRVVLSTDADPRITSLISQDKLADISNRMTGGILFEKEISRQRLSADFNWTHTRFERFSLMNNNLISTNGKWNWFLGNRLEGNMGASYVQSLMPFIFQPGLRIIRTEQTQFFNAAWRFHPSWRLVGEYTRYDLDTGKNPRADNLNRTENRFEAGIDYLTPGKNTLGILFRNILGDFTNPVRIRGGTLVLDDNGSPVDNGYDQKEVLAKVDWKVSAKSQLQGTAGWVERQNNSFQQRDFSGFNGRIIYHWQPTDKLGLTVNGWRLTSVMQNLTANFSLNTGVSVVPSWNVTQKVRLEGDLSYETRKFDRFSDLTDPTSVVGRNNTLRNAALKLAYSPPYRGLQVSASIYHTDLKSDATAGGFSANGASINLQYVYGQR